MKNTKNEMTLDQLDYLIQEGKLADVETKPIIPGQSAPIVPNAPSQFYTGSLPPNLSNDAQFNKNAYQTPGVAVHPLMPLPPSAVANVNSASNSAANTNQYLIQQSKNAALIAVGTALPGTVVASGTVVTPATLNSVADSTTRYAQNSSNLTYGLSENPLTSFDSGSGSAAIDVDSFNLITSTKGTISVNGGSIALLSYNTVYYCFYSDPELTGGSVVFNATLDKNLAFDGPGNIFIGSIQTAVSGGPVVQGNGNGGSAGAPTGLVNTFVMSTVASTGTDGNGSVSNLQNFLDNDQTTFATVSVTGDSGTNDAFAIVSGPPGIANQNFTTATLNVYLKCTANSLNGTYIGGAVSIRVNYGTAGPGGSTTVAAGVKPTSTTLLSTLAGVTVSSYGAGQLVQIPLDPTTNLSQVVAYILVSSGGTDSAGTCSANCYIAWITTIQ